MIKKSQNENFLKIEYDLKQHELGGVKKAQIQKSQEIVIDLKEVFDELKWVGWDPEE